MRKVLLITSMYIAAIVGAGFASGQEIVSFFIRYGKLSFFGILLAAILFGFFAYAILEGCRRYRCRDFDSYAGKIAGPVISRLVRIIICGFMFCVFCAMISGSGETCSVLFGIPKVYGMTATAILCLIIFFYQKKGFLAFNSIFGIFIIFGILFTCVYILKYREIHVFASHAVKMSLSSASYVSYNILTAGVTLAMLSAKAGSKRVSISVGILSALVMFLMMLGIWAVVSIYYHKIPLGEIPMLTLALRQSIPLAVFYGIILFAAMITTAIASGYGVIEMLGGFKLKRGLIACMVVSMGYLLGGCRFSALIDIAYRGCGYLGLVLLVIVIADEIRNMNLLKKQSK